MPFDGFGVFQRVRNWVADATAGIKIRADYHDTEDDGFATGLSNCITRDGQSIVTQNIPFNSKRITGLADPVNAQDASTKNYTDTKFTSVGTPVNPGDVTNKSYVDAGDAATAATAAAATAAANTNANSRVLRAGDSMSGALNMNAALNINNGAPFTAYVAAGTIGQGGASSAMFQGAGGGNEAFMSFHRPGSYALNFGLNAINKLAIGGWSLGAVQYQLWTAQDCGFPVSNGRLVFAGDGQLMVSGGINIMLEPFAGAVMSGWSYTLSSGVNPTVQYFRFRYVQLLTNAWFTVGYA